MSLAVLGIGTALPKYRYTQDEIVAIARTASCRTPDDEEVLEKLYRHTHIESRYMVHSPVLINDIAKGTNESGTGFFSKGPDDRGPDTAERMAMYVRDALPLAKDAAGKALEEANVSPSSITHLVTVSCTGFSAPGFDIGLIKHLGLPPEVGRTHVGFMGCHGALNGLRVARSFVESQRQARVLLCAVEISSIHYYYCWDPKRMVGNALFADGAAALVGAPDKESESQDWRAIDNGSCVFADSEFAMTWSIGNYGFDMTLSAKIPNLIAAHLRPWLEQWLASHRLTIADIGSWAIHPGGPRVVSSVEEALGLPPKTAWASYEVLANCGNMSSPTVLFIVNRLRQKNSPRPCVALGFGPGLTVEAALFG
ncbi:MAG TPA: type III polyketide synthase [Gemmataceae bacterium]|jgi:predicted naringenin-chalcone synthase|nr:type III polyketide synthase [Gemmataceae bacterium]